LCSVLQDFIKSAVRLRKTRSGLEHFTRVWSIHKAKLLCVWGNRDNVKLIIPFRTWICKMSPGPLAREKSDLAPCWTTNVRDSAVIPVFGLTCTSLVAQEQMSASGTIMRSHVVRVKIRPYLNSHTFLLIQCLARRSARVFAVSIFRRAPRGPKRVRWQWQIHKHKLDQAEHLSLHIRHADTNIPRQYTLYIETPTARSNWCNVLVDAIGVRKARQDDKVFALPHQSSTCLSLILRPNGTDHKRLTTASSACLGRTSLRRDAFYWTYTLCRFIS